MTNIVSQVQVDVKLERKIEGQVVGRFLGNQCQAVLQMADQFSHMDQSLDDVRTMTGALRLVSDEESCLRIGEGNQGQLLFKPVGVQLVHFTLATILTRFWAFYPLPVCCQI